MTPVSDDDTRLSPAELFDKVKDQALVVKALTEQNKYLREEMDRYHQEARDSAKVVGGILRVLRENDLIPGWRERVPL